MADIGWQSLFEQTLARKFAGKVISNAPMSNYTSYKIGGNADYLIIPEQNQDIIDILVFVRENKVPLTVIGKGTNLLVSDYGISGIVLQIGEKFSEINWLPDNTVWAGAGVAMSVLAVEAAKKSLTGLEWSVGIPGNLGGALIMNAGAYGKNISHFVTKIQVVEYIEPRQESTSGSGLLKTIPACDLVFDYRFSSILPGQIVVGAELKLQPGDMEASQAEMRQLLKTRSENQPLDYPSAGSVFVNPPGDHAGRLVEAAGCKGMYVGGAQVSEKHGNFIINRGGATAADVLSLIAKVQEQVKAKFGVVLQTEVRKIGRN